MNKLFSAAAVTLAFAAPAFAQDEKKPEHPAVNAGRPTITDPAALTAPNWIEVEMGIQKTLVQNRQLLTPVLFKLTSGNKRMEYRLATDGSNRFSDGMGGHVDGIGDTYVAFQYLIVRQSQRVWDTAARATVKVPTASGSRGVGTGKTDYGVLLLASKDVTPALHVDLNAGYTAIGRPVVGGFDNQGFAAISTTIPIPHSLWSYTNEVAWYSAVPGIGDQLTTMHGFAYAAKPWDVWDVAVQYGLSRDAPKWQILFGRTFFLGKLGK